MPAGPVDIPARLAHPGQLTAQGRGRLVVVRHLFEPLDDQEISRLQERLGGLVVRQGGIHPATLQGPVASDELDPPLLDVILWPDRAEDFFSAHPVALKKEKMGHLERGGNGAPD